jgi:predicted outer membrane repeat protein
MHKIDINNSNRSVSAAPKTTRLTLLIFISTLIVFVTLTIQTAPQANAATLAATPDCNDSIWTVANEAELNAAITCYNAKGAGNYSISLTDTISLTANTTPINNSTAASLMINGNNHTIDGDGQGRILNIQDSDVTVSLITIQNGIADTVPCTSCGGGVYIGSAAVVTLTQTTLSENSAIENGGGIYSEGVLTLSNSTLNGNSADEHGGGIYSKEGTLTVNNSTLSDNTAASNGGGIYNFSGTLTVNNSTLNGNSAEYNGGGIRNILSDSITTISNSTLSDNSANEGGGINMYSGTLTVSNSTLSGNSADGGGGIFMRTGRITVSNSTLSGNSASASAGGGIYRRNGKITLSNSIVANSTSGGDCDGTITADASNLDSDGSCGNATQKSLGEINLGPLQDNGGSASTHALLSDSVAIDAATTDGAITIDQRGIVRPQGDVPDIGAYELIQYSLSVVPAGSGSGSVVSDPTGINCGVTCTVSIIENSAITLTATTDDGSVFTGWSGSGSGTSNSITVTIDAVKSVTATFETLYTFTKATDGTGTGVIGKSPDAISYTHGTAVTLTATADSNSTFISWSGSATGTTNPITVTIDAAKSVTATFTIKSYELITATAGTGSGSIAKSSDAISYTHGTVVTLTATADNGSTFTGWSGSGSGTSNSITVTIDAVKSVTATFETLYTFTKATDGSGTGVIGKSPDAISYTHGTVVTLTATADSSSTFTGWHGSVSGTTNPITVAIDAAKSVTATFTFNDYELTTTTAGTGSGSIAKSPDAISYTHGTTVTLTATADSGSAFTGWSGASCTGTDSCIVTLDEAKSVTATFDLEEFTIFIPIIGRP